MRHNILTGIAGFGLALGVAGTAFAQSGLEIVGRPVDKLTGFQPAVTPAAHDLQALDHMLNIIMLAIVVFVSGLLIWCILRYNRRANPTPASFTHNTPIEITWTVIPIVILVFIGAFSLPVLFDVAFDSFMIGGSSGGGDNRLTPEVEAQLVEAGYSKEEFLLATDTAVVVPIGKTVVVQVTGADVIHSWTIPAFGVKQDGVPGRLAELWFNADREGVYFGQCSELCGIAHAYMPITVKVVSQEVYDTWLAAAKTGEVVLSDATLGAKPLTAAQND